MPGFDANETAAPPAPGLFTPGFTLYIALALDEADHQKEGSAIGHAARVTLAGFHRYLETLRIGTPEWAEHHSYLQIAIDLAAGRRTRKTTKDKMYRAADDEFEREYERIVCRTAMGAILQRLQQVAVISEQYQNAIVSSKRLYEVLHAPPTVAVTPATSPASTGIAVTADLSSIGGSAGQTFFDDGTHGDLVSGDRLFSFSATIPLASTESSGSAVKCAALPAPPLLMVMASGRRSASATTSANDR